MWLALALLLFTQPTFLLYFAQLIFLSLAPLTPLTALTLLAVLTLLSLALLTALTHLAPTPLQSGDDGCLSSEHRLRRESSILPHCQVPEADYI